MTVGDVADTSRIITGVPGLLELVEMIISGTGLRKMMRMGSLPLRRNLFRSRRTQRGKSKRRT